MEIAEWLEFADHHRYHPRELRHLGHHMAAMGAAALVTTQKDAINLCDSAGDLVAPLPIYWLEIAVKIDREEEFLRLVTEILPR